MKLLSSARAAGYRRLAASQPAEWTALLPLKLLLLVSPLVTANTHKYIGMHLTPHPEPSTPVDLPFARAPRRLSPHLTLGASAVTHIHTYSFGWRSGVTAARAATYEKRHEA